MSKLPTTTSVAGRLARLIRAALTLGIAGVFVLVGAALIHGQYPTERPVRRGVVATACLIAANLYNRYHWLFYPLTLFVVTRTLIFVVLIAGPVMINPSNGWWQDFEKPDTPLWNAGLRWDGGWYITIVREGYSYKPYQSSDVAFFPFYTLLIRLVTPLTGDDRAAGMLISNACLLSALIVLYRLTEYEFRDRATAERAVFYAAAAPTSVFFSAIYTESTFLLLAVGGLYYARWRRWYLAGILGMYASATRSIGVVMLAVVGLEWLRVHGWTLSRAHRWRTWRSLFDSIRCDWHTLPALALIPLGLLAYMEFLYSRFGDPLLFIKAVEGWGRKPGDPFNVLVTRLAELPQFNLSTAGWNNMLDVLNILTALAFCLLGLVAWRRLGAAYGVYTLLGVLIPLSGGPDSMIRYVVVLFPAYMLLAQWGRHVLVHHVIVAVFPLLLGVFTLMFASWYFIG